MREEDRELTRDQEFDITAMVLLWVIPAAVGMSAAVLMAAGRCG